jgi:two-component sensor histidine kinase
MHIADVSDAAHDFPAQDALTQPAPTAGGFRSLRFQFLVLLCIALGPIAILGILEALSAYANERHRVEEGYLQAASADAHAQQHMLSQAYDLLSTVAQQRAVRRGLDPVCESLMREAINAMPGFASMIATDRDGRVICSSSSTNPAASHADIGWLQEVLHGRNYNVSAAATDGALRGQALRAAIPLRDEDGKIVGSLSVITPTRDLDRPATFNAIRRKAFAAIARDDGTIIAAASSNDALTEKLPSPPEMQSLLAHPGTVQRMTGVDGHRRLFAAIAMEPNLEMVFGQESPSWWSADGVGRVLIPILLWLVALGSVWLIVERLVLRWTIYLSRIAVTYGRGHFIVLPQDTEGAPQEFRELGRTLANMARLVRDRQRQLQRTLEQKSMLVREVNHRVKNNLQIIQSLLNLQARTIENRQQLAAFITARDRISTLAMIHQSLYETESLEYVELRPLFEQLCRHLLASGWADSKDISLETDIADLIVTAGVAVPLALLTTEAVTNALKHAFAGRKSGAIRVSLTATADESVLCIGDDGIGAEAARRRRRRAAGIGQSLIDGFARQLGGIVETVGGDGTIVTVRFPSLMRAPT